MTCQSCVDTIEKKLNKVEGIDNVAISLEKGTVLVQTSLPSSIVQQSIEDTGRRAVIKGYGGVLTRFVTTQASRGVSSAVAMLGGTTGYSKTGVQGVVRLVQADPDVCVIDGTIDGLSPGLHGLHIHECGDISRGCDSVGDHFSLVDSQHGGPTDINRHTGDLGNIEAGADGRAVFRLEDSCVKVNDVLGRSIVVTEQPDDLGRGSNLKSPIDGNSGQRLACGIISRSAGLFENSKKICACDGVTLWDERDKPLAGPGRRNPSPASNL
ncbi:hypothetical protein AAG570_011046 [Ranatra chinensis]|uniref:Extracellular superoxide dismutase [Cu-Zn] n=1 Tax=Ranatra chinensis TaxID=642074 RepID=A0ABD0Z7S8_9HEMI